MNYTKAAAVWAIVIGLVIVGYEVVQLTPLLVTVAVGLLFVIGGIVALADADTNNDDEDDRFDVDPDRLESRRARTREDACEGRRDGA